MKPSITLIQPIGEYFQNDHDGFVINPASWDNIPTKYQPIIEQVKQKYTNHFGGKLHSVYLRGSLVRGLAVDNLSDFDSFALVKEKGLRWEDAPWAKGFSQNLSLKYKFVGDFEFILSSIHDGHFLENRNLSMIIKTQSICIFGDDLSPYLPKFKPDKTMMLNHRWLALDLKNFIQNKELTNHELKAFYKVVIRTGYELVMTREGKFTPDLYLCVESFSKYYPERKEAMENTLFNFLNPQHFSESKRKSTIELSNWLLEKVKSRVL